MQVQIDVGTSITVWSLRDLLRLYFPTFCTALGHVERAVGALMVGIDLGKFDDSQERLSQALVEMRTELEHHVPISDVLTLQLERLQKQVSEANVDDWKMVVVLVREFEQNLLNELTKDLFLMVPGNRKWFWLQEEPPFGEAVANTFPSAKDDIAAAGRCLALDEWTACVFHLMRVLEQGLRWMAHRVQLPMVDSIDFQNWNVIITNIENEIQRLRNLPRANRPSPDDLQFLSEAASSFRHFKDAWRNHVSHSRTKYDSREATALWNNVRSFMQHLAS